MEYWWDFSKEGSKKFYSMIERKRQEIEELFKSPEEKEPLLGLIEQNIKIYEKERIEQANLVIEMVKQNGYSPKEAYAFIKKVKESKLKNLENKTSNQNKPWNN